MEVKFVASVAKHETIEHLFFYCHYAKFFLACHPYCFGFPQLTNFRHLFGTWSERGGRKQNILLLIGVATCATLFGSQKNYCVFNNCQSKIFLRVLSSGTH
jgi:hypothetical protein